MYGFQDLASQQQQRFWVYTSNGVTNGFQTWSKPPGISFVHIICIGPGGGGSGAVAFQSGTAWRGGGGGGSGAMNSAFLPAFLVPDILYINVGLGGAGGAASTTATPNAGSAGGLTYVSFWPSQTAGYALCMASFGGGATVPTAGGAGAAGGTGGTAATTTNFPTSQVGLRTFIAGTAGGRGGTIDAPGILATNRVTGGGGGAGNTVAGATLATGTVINPIGQYSLQNISPSPVGTQGSSLIDLVKFVFSGGTGAGSSSTISGSAGGNGGYGCGGGGGGVGPGLGGAGGKGGDGLVIITCG
jgi:hypothetical protein